MELTTHYAQLKTKEILCPAGFADFSEQVFWFTCDQLAVLTVTTPKTHIVFRHSTQIPSFGELIEAAPDSDDPTTHRFFVYSNDLHTCLLWGHYSTAKQKDELFRSYALYQAWAAKFTPQAPQPSIPVESITGPKLLAAQALASGSTSDLAAAIAKVSPRTIENWKKDPDFRQVRDTFTQAFAANPFPTTGLHLIAQLAQALTLCQTHLGSQGKAVPAQLKAQLRKGLTQADAFLTKHGASSSLTK